MTAVTTVVVAHEMRRELPRTLLSLVPPHQRPVPGGMEIIVVDNGSRMPLRPADVTALGARVRIEVLEDAGPSPVAAANRGLALASGEVVGVFIDGARLATPGIVAAARRVCSADPRAVVATPNYHLGPPSAAGCSPDEEDRLLAAIGWPGDGYRLLDVATAAPLSGVDGPMLETNALFMHRDLWREVGFYDERFRSPGGGAANPDVFRRALERPGTTLVRLLGEGTVHQNHGGVTSNAPDLAATLKAIGREYGAIRGRPLAAWRGAMRLYDPATDRFVSPDATADPTVPTPSEEDGRWTAVRRRGSSGTPRRWRG